MRAAIVVAAGSYAMRAAAAAAALLVAGCTLIPHYDRPELPVAPDWPDDSLAGGSAERAPAGAPAAADVGWRDFFADPALQRLIAIAIDNNRDARIAAINVAAARAQYRIQRAELFPTIGVTGQYNAQRTPGDVLGSQFSGAGTGAGTGTGTGAGTGTGTVVTQIPDHIISRTWSVDVGVTSYELDIFGRIRSLSRARLEEYFGYVETQRSAVISLVAEVASAYLQLLADDALLQTTRETLNSQRRSREIVYRAVEGGVETALPLRQAETQVQTAGANLAAYTQRVAQDRHALALLLGVPLPTDLPVSLPLDDQRLIEDLPAGLPSDLLARRPDVRAAEHNLLAANASIGAARAAFFPAITLTGSFGTASTELKGLFDSGSRSWSFLPQVYLPIFTGGANTANLRYAEEQKKLYVARYEQTIQTAFREVADALTARATLVQQESAQTALRRATKEAYRLAQLRYDAGIDTFLNVLDSQRSDYTAQQDLINVKLARQQNLVTLYKALGGGWTADTASAARR